MLEQGYLCFSWRLLCSYKWLWQCKRLPWVPDTHNTGPEQRHCYQLCLGFSLSFFFFLFEQKKQKPFQELPADFDLSLSPCRTLSGPLQEVGRRAFSPIYSTECNKGFGKVLVSREMVPALMPFFALLSPTLLVLLAYSCPSPSQQ